jgi:hypothetical protein
MTFLRPIFLVVSGASAGAAAVGAGNRPGQTATTAGLDAANQATPVATTIGANISLRPALTSAGRNLTAEKTPAACDFQMVLRIRGEMGGLYD